MQLFPLSSRISVIKLHCCLAEQTWWKKAVFSSSSNSQSLLYRWAQYWASLVASLHGSIFREVLWALSISLRLCWLSNLSIFLISWIQEFFSSSVTFFYLDCQLLMRLASCLSLRLKEYPRKPTWLVESYHPFTFLLILCSSKLILLKWKGVGT